MNEIKENNFDVEKSSFKVEITNREENEASKKFWARQYYKNTIKGLKEAGVEITPQVEENMKVVANSMGNITGEKEEKQGIESLTGLKTKEIFWQNLKEIIGQTKRNYKDGNPQPFSLILLDVDNFKDANTKSGYQWGDQILKEVGATLKDNVQRATDIVARFGGEEFCVILPDCNPENGFKIAEKVREDIKKIGITASFGLASSSDGSESPEEIFDMANVACAIAKGTEKHVAVNGEPKNRVVLWAAGMPSSLKNKEKGY